MGSGVSLPCLGPEDQTSERRGKGIVFQTNLNFSDSFGGCYDLSGCFFFSTGEMNEKTTTNT